jgi:hypothetical protein
MKKRREAETGRSLTRARRALDAWKRLKRRPADWKFWVARRAGVTRNWLSYRVAEGKLTAPKPPESPFKKSAPRRR